VALWRFPVFYKVTLFVLVIRFRKILFGSKGYKVKAAPGIYRLHSRPVSKFIGVRMKPAMALAGQKRAENRKIVTVRFQARS